MMHIEPKPGIYKHSKTGDLVRLHFIVKHSETLEDMIVYEHLAPHEHSQFWVRPLSMWSETVNIEGKYVPRFVYVGE